MNKKILFPIVMIAIAALFGSGCNFSGPKTTVSPSVSDKAVESGDTAIETPNQAAESAEKTEVDASDTTQQAGESADFAKAIEAGLPTRCVIASGANKIEVQMKGKKSAITMTSVMNGRTTVNHIINDDAYVYTWEDASKSGIKMALTNPSNAATPTFTKPSDYTSYQSQGYSVKCEPANLDDSAFALPTNIKFIDPAEMVKSLPPPPSAEELEEQIRRIEELNKGTGVGG